MVASFNKPLIRAVYVLNGVVFSLAGVGAFVLFAPRDLLPRLVARPLLDLAPWLVRGGTAQQPSVPEVLLAALICGAIALAGLRTLVVGVFGSPAGVRVGVGGEDTE